MLHVQYKHVVAVPASMEPDGSAVEVLSPESTVTTLFSNTGHLRSTLVPHLNSTIRYNEKDYDSASAVLDAYIADFQWSCRNSESFTGSLILPETPSSTPTKLSRRTPRRQDVLKERLTATELDFLNLPVSSLHHRSNRDRHSMTTDELLAIPLDGSMPVTHTSAFIQGLSRSRVDHTARLGHRVQEGYRWKRGVDAATVQSDHSKLEPPLSVSELDPPSSLHQSQWFMGHKEEVHSTNITSLPNMRYPAWLQRCKLDKQHSESNHWEGTPPPGMRRAGMGEASSWVMHPDKCDSVDMCALSQHQKTLRDLRLSLAEQIYLLATEKQCSPIKESLLRDNKLERLIDKADQVLNTLSQTSGFADTILDQGSRVVDRHVDATEPLHCYSTLEAAVAAAAPAGSRTDSGSLEEDGTHDRKQPGPLEALKQMMFRLQAVEAELQRQSPTSTLSDARPPGQKKGESKAKMKRLDEGPLLQSTLRDLNQMKLREVKPKLKPGNKEEENDPDEGHCSSLSADGFTCVGTKSELSLTLSNHRCPR
ncbi:lung adenoma susceptibility protein 2 isoform 2-T2 [Synchiropus picturatus]